MKAPDDSWVYVDIIVVLHQNMRLMLLQDHLSLIEEDGALAEDIRSQNESTGMLGKVPARMERTARANSTCRHLDR